MEQKLCQKNNWKMPCPEICGELCSWWLSNKCLLAEGAKPNELIAYAKKLQAENKRLKKVILNYGKGQDFDWDVLERIDQLGECITDALVILADYDGYTTTEGLKTLVDRVSKHLQTMKPMVFKTEKEWKAQEALKGKPK